MVKKRGLNVGVDCHNFTPIDLDTVLFYHNAIQRYYDKDVFCEQVIIIDKIKIVRTRLNKLYDMIETHIQQKI